MVEQQTINHEDEILMLEKDSVVSIETIQNKQIQNSIMDSNPIPQLNNHNTQVKETPSLLDPAIKVKKVISFQTFIKTSREPLPVQGEGLLFYNI